MEDNQEYKYKEGEVVYDRIRPHQKLIVSRHIGKIYYCKIEEAPYRKELTYFERELKSDLTDKN